MKKRILFPLLALAALLAFFFTACSNDKIEPFNFEEYQDSTGSIDQFIKDWKDKCSRDDAPPECTGGPPPPPELPSSDSSPGDQSSDSNSGDQSSDSNPGQSNSSSSNATNPPQGNSSSSAATPTPSSSSRASSSSTGSSGGGKITSKGDLPGPALGPNASATYEFDIPASTWQYNDMYITCSNNNNGSACTATVNVTGGHTVTETLKGDYYMGRQSLGRPTSPSFSITISTDANCDKVTCKLE